MDWILFLHIFTIINKVLLFPLYFFRKDSSGAIGSSPSAAFCLSPRSYPTSFFARVQSPIYHVPLLLAACYLGLAGRFTSFIGWKCWDSHSGLPRLNYCTCCAH